MTEQAKWQLIETAPKDGRPILTINRGGGWLNISRWDTGFETFMGANDGMPSRPTHWVPIPVFDHQSASVADGPLNER